MKGMNGTMIRKIRSNWLPILLIIAIVVSLLLSWATWTNPSRDNSTDTDESSSTTAKVTNRAISDVFLPTQIIKNNTDGTQNLMYPKKRNLVVSAQQILQKWKFGRVEKLSTGSHSKYLSYLQRKDSLVMSYNDAVTTSVLNKVYDQSINTKKISKVQRIVVPRHNPKYIYLLNDDGFKVYRAKISKFSSMKLLRQITGESAKRYPIKTRLLNKTIIIDYTKPIKVPTYSYLLSKQTGNSFMSTLMNADQNESVSMHTEDNVTTYTDGTDKRMSVDNSTSMVTYENFASKDRSYSDSELLTDSFKKLTTIGVLLDNTRFESVDNSKNVVTYRDYVGGIPIYNSNNYGTMTVSYSSNNVQRYTFSLFSLQVPVPNKLDSKELPSTDEVISSLEAKGINEKDIKGIRLEYEWKASESSDMVIDLEANYYVNYNNQWVKYTDVTNSD